MRMDNKEKEQAELEKVEYREETAVQEEIESMESEKRQLPLPPSLWQKGMTVLLGVALSALLGLGIALPLRPSYSDSEKRALQEFPAFTAGKLWSGTFFTELSSWFSDSFPFREQLLTGSSRLEGIYGLKGEAVYLNGEQEKEEIPTAALSPAPTLALTDIGDAGDAENTDNVESHNGDLGTGEGSPDTGGAGNTSTAGDIGNAADGGDIGSSNSGSGNGSNGGAETEAPVFETDAAGNLILPKTEGEVGTIQGEKAGNIYVTDHRAFELFYFSQKNVTAYASMLNTVKTLLPEVTVYDMIVPNSYGVQLDSAVQGKLASSGMDMAIDFCYSLMSPDIVRVPVFETLSEHKGDYIYFHTDHHWTQLGAYYAYREFCKAKGITPHELSDFSSVEYPEFYGTFYFATNRAESLKQNPDTVQAWLPMGTNDMSFRNKDGVSVKAHVVNDGSAMLAGNRYNTFLLGDNPYTEIVNPKINDGSAIVLVKESYGNAFAPFLVDHYQYVYVVDYRYDKENLTDFIATHQVKDVLFLNNVMALGEKTSREMLGLFH